MKKHIRQLGSLSLNFRGSKKKKTLPPTIMEMENSPFAD